MTQKTPDDPYKIEAEPTKELFISMLVKDIQLRDAIGDLVDNSVDGARNSAKNKENLKDFFIHINTENNVFKISDNCGGIPIAIAREHAFRFGRPESYTPKPGSIGQFGIGMKRAFFKIGKNINITSVEKKSNFTLNIDVEKWKKPSEGWNFKFTTIDENTSNLLKNTGTTIEINDLNDEARDSFNDKTFISQLGHEIALEQMLNINRGLSVKINDVKLVAPKITLKTDDSLKPYYYNYKFPATSLSIKIIAGISEDDSEDGGWYVFCNDRLIMGRDKSAATGWTGKFGDGVAEYHDQYYRFRGYAFFSADNVKDLPWNTTKTGMNLDSPEYKFVRSKMIEAMRMIMTLMNKLKTEKEKDNPTENQVLNNKIDSIKPIALSTIINNEKTLSELEDKFYFPPEFSPVKSKETTISYKIPNDRLRLVKEHLDMSKPSDIGQYTFDYFFDNEIG